MAPVAVRGEDDDVWWLWVMACDESGWKRDAKEKQSVQSVQFEEKHIELVQYGRIREEAMTVLETSRRKSWHRWRSACGPSGSRACHLHHGHVQGKQLCASHASTTGGRRWRRRWLVKQTERKLKKSIVHRLKPQLEL
jgi:hypothetical protein